MARDYMGRLTLILPASLLAYFLFLFVVGVLDITGQRRLVNWKFKISRKNKFMFWGTRIAGLFVLLAGIIFLSASIWKQIYGQ